MDKRQMTKEKLIQYCDLQEETRKLKNRIDKLRNQSEMVSDVVQNGYKHHAVIYGYDIYRANKINRLETILQKRYDDLLNLQIEIEEYISTIKDSKTRQIFEHRYIDNMNWIQVGYQMKSTADAVRMKHDRFLEEIL